MRRSVHLACLLLLLLLGASWGRKLRKNGVERNDFNMTPSDAPDHTRHNRDNTKFIINLDDAGTSPRYGDHKPKSTRKGRRRLKAKTTTTTSTTPITPLQTYDEPTAYEGYFNHPHLGNVGKIFNQRDIEDVYLKGNDDYGKTVKDVWQQTSPQRFQQQQDTYKTLAPMDNEQSPTATTTTTTNWGNLKSYNHFQNDFVSYSTNDDSSHPEPTHKVKTSPKPNYDISTESTNYYGFNNNNNNNNNNYIKDPFSFTITPTNPSPYKASTHRPKKTNTYDPEKYYELGQEMYTPTAAPLHTTQPYKPYKDHFKPNVWDSGEHSQHKLHDHLSKNPFLNPHKSPQVNSWDSGERGVESHKPQKVINYWDSREHGAESYKPHNINSWDSGEHSAESYKPHKVNSWDSGGEHAAESYKSQKVSSWDTPTTTLFDPIKTSHKFGGGSSNTIKYYGFDKDGVKNDPWVPTKSYASNYNFDTKPYAEIQPTKITIPPYPFGRYTSIHSSTPVKDYASDFDPKGNPKGVIDLSKDFSPDFMKSFYEYNGGGSGIAYGDHSWDNVKGYASSYSYSPYYGVGDYNKNNVDQQQQLQQLHQQHRFAPQLPAGGIVRPIIVPVPQPYPVKVPIAKPVAVPILKEIKVPIEKVVPYPVFKNVPYPVEKHIPVPVEKQVPVPVPQPYPVKIPVIKNIYHHADEGHGHGHGHDHAHDDHDIDEEEDFFDEHYHNHHHNHMRPHHHQKHRGPKRNRKQPKRRPSHRPPRHHQRPRQPHRNRKRDFYARF